MIMKKFYVAMFAVLVTISMVFVGCSSPVGVQDVINTITGGGGGSGDGETPRFPPGFEDYITQSLADGSLAAKAVDFNSKGDLTGYGQKTVTENGFKGQLLEGQWLSGEWKDGEWIPGGAYVDGVWMIGEKVENILVGGASFSGNVPIAWPLKAAEESNPIKDDKGETIGTLIISDKGKDNGYKKVGYEILLNEPENMLVTVYIERSVAVNGNKKETQHGTVGSFLIDSSEKGVSIDLEIETWDGTWSCFETEDGEPFFIVDDLVYTIGDKTVNDNDFYKYGDDAIFEIGAGDSEIFLANDGASYMAGDNFYEYDSRIFVFGSGSEKVFAAADGYHWDGDGNDFVKYDDNNIILVNGEGFVPDENGPDVITHEVDDPSKPIYALVTMKAFDMEIEFEDEVVVIGQGNIFYSAGALDIDIEFDPFFALLLSALDEVSISCNGEEVIDNYVQLAYTQNEDFSFAFEFAFQTAEDVFGPED